jgi:hypothetical protein
MPRGTASLLQSRPRDVTHPFLVNRRRRKISVQSVESDGLVVLAVSRADFAFLGPPARYQSFFSHQSGYFSTRTPHPFLQEAGVNAGTAVSLAGPAKHLCYLLG